MNAAFKITKVRCPSCDGTGIWGSMSIALGRSLPCNWCNGAKRLPAAEAIDYAENIYTIAVGGYVCGDHDKADADRMTAKAEAVYALLQQVPSWQRTAA